MNILLINTNPVVSRLLVLCTRDATVILEEVSTSQEIQCDAYDIVFVDEASYGRDVSEVLAKVNIVKKVFISYRNDEMRGFDMTIKKPFLPSQIIDVIKGVELSLEVADSIEDTVEESSIEEELKETLVEERSEVSFIEKIIIDEEPIEKETVVLESLEDVIRDVMDDPMILDGNEIEKIKALLEMGEEVESTDNVFSEEELEVRKIEVIKEQLIAEGVEIVEENAIVEELSVDLNGVFTLKNDIKMKKTKSKKSKKLKLIENAVMQVMKNLTKKERQKLLKGKEITIHVKLEEND